MYMCIYRLAQTRTVACYTIDPSSRQGGRPMIKSQLSWLQPKLGHESRRSSTPGRTDWLIQTDRPSVVQNNVSIYVMRNRSTEWRNVSSLHPQQLLPLPGSVGIALGYGLDDRGSRVRFPMGAGNFFLHHRVQNGSGAHPASYPMGTRDSFPEGKAAGAWSWQLTSL
jgi:hypothetical protein